MTRGAATLAGRSRSSQFLCGHRAGSLRRCRTCVEVRISAAGCAWGGRLVEGGVGKRTGVRVRSTGSTPHWNHEAVERPATTLPCRRICNFRSARQASARRPNCPPLTPHSLTSHPQPEPTAHTKPRSASNERRSKVGSGGGEVVGRWLARVGVRVPRAECTSRIQLVRVHRIIGRILIRRGRGHVVLSRGGLAGCPLAGCGVTLTFT